MGHNPAVNETGRLSQTDRAHFGCPFLAPTWLNFHENSLLFCMGKYLLHFTHWQISARGHFVVSTRFFSFFRLLLEPQIMKYRISSLISSAPHKNYDGRPRPLKKIMPYRFNFKSGNHTHRNSLGRHNAGAFSTAHISQRSHN